MLESLLSRFPLLVGTVRVRNAMTPLLWLCGGVTIPAIAGCVVADGVVRYLLFVLASVPVVFAMVMYWRLFEKDPKLLQSEEFQLRQHIIERHGDDEREMPVVEAVLESELERAPDHSKTKDESG